MLAAKSFITYQSYWFEHNSDRKRATRFLEQRRKRQLNSGISSSVSSVQDMMAQNTGYCWHMRHQSMLFYINKTFHGKESWQLNKNEEGMTSNANEKWTKKSRCVLMRKHISFRNRNNDSVFCLLLFHFSVICTSTWNIMCKNCWTSNYVSNRIAGRCCK